MADNTFHSYYKNNPNTITSSSFAASASASASTSDEISDFLQQILVRSSNSLAHQGKYPQFLYSSSPSVAALPDYLHRSDLATYGGDGITGGDCSGGVVPAGNPNVSSSSFGASENENDEYDCESEEGLEAFAEEAAAKPGSGRSSSKRSRAAEVHNMSEKRRRSRINEKMKALQMLIPNSNKTDKASMLDEAIEYLKHLQLQVQMLSMRNGVSLHPLCLPGSLQPALLSQMRMNIGEDNRPVNFNMTGTLRTNQEPSTQNIYGLSNHSTAANQSYIPDMSNVVNPESSFGLESSIQTHFGPFQLTNSSEDICREDLLQHPQVNVNCSLTNPLDFELGATATNSHPFNAQISDQTGSSSLGAASLGRDRHGAGLLKTIEQNFQIDSMRAGRRIRTEDVKNERRRI